MVLDFFLGKSGRENAQSTDVSLTKFYMDCVEAYHDEAEKCGLTDRGVIFIPELIPYGEQAVLSLFKDRFYSMEFKDNPYVYYYAIMSLALQTGIVYAAKWHENFPEMQGYSKRIEKRGPADDCKPCLRQMGLGDSGVENAFYNKIYKIWVEKHEPYWKMRDPREYTFKATLAAYQLGVSLMLAKLGY